MSLNVDSALAEGSERVARSADTLPPTLAQLHQLAMRDHTREAVLRWWSGERWELMPDWRFDRQAIRLALFLRERFRIGPSEVVLLAGDLSPELIVAEFAVISLGAVALTVDLTLPVRQLAAAIAAAAPSAALLSGAARGLQGVSDVVSANRVLALDGDAPAAALPFGMALDLGGTLDTPERASALRVAAREIAPDRPALRHVERAPSGALVVGELTQGEVVESARRHWEAAPAAPGDLVYIAEHAPNLSLRALICACVADGHSSLVLGAPDRAARDLPELRPGKLIAPSEVLTAMLASASETFRPAGWTPWRGLAVRLLRDREATARRAVLEAFGGRIRWIGCSSPLDPVLAGGLSAVARLTPLP